MKKYDIWIFLVDTCMALSIAAIVIAWSGGMRWDPLGPISISIHDYNRGFSSLCVMLFLRLILSAPTGFSLKQRIDCIIAKAGSLVDRVTAMRTLIFMATVLAVFLAASPMIRYFLFGDMPDLCIHVEAMQSSLKGELFREPFNYQMFHTHEMGFDIDDPRVCAFADHFKPLLFLYVPIFKLFPSAVTLLIIQALLIASGLFPLFFLAREKLKNEKWALTIAASYCFYPPVLGTAWSFFPSVASMSFLLWAFWWASKERHVMMWIFLLLTLSSKEMMALPVFSFGAYAFLIDKKRIHGSVIAATGMAWLIVCLYWIVPAFAPSGEYPYYSLYSSSSGSFHGMIIELLTDPCRLCSIIFSEQILCYLLGLLATVGFLPLVGWRVWILSLPVLAQNILPSTVYVFPSWPAGLWSAPIVPFTFMAIIWAAAKMNAKYSPQVARYALFIMVAASFICMPMSRHKGRWRVPAFTELTAYLEENVSANSKISTNIMLTWPYWSTRYDLSRFPFNIDDNDYAILLMPYNLPGKFRDVDPDRMDLGTGTIKHFPIVNIKSIVETSYEEYWSNTTVEYYCRIAGDGRFIKQKVFDLNDGSRVVVLKNKQAE